jgi:nitroimidazol reductase NimA-like FMN-containing flavoprotein (pyridoxamine 5'-phosphate oxidase superfamily)
VNLPMGKLMPAECRRLIAPGGVGRIAFGTISGPVVLPVNFAVLADTIVIRTAEGTTIDGHADGWTPGTPACLLPAP